MTFLGLRYPLQWISKRAAWIESTVVAWHPAEVNPFHYVFIALLKPQGQNGSMPLMYQIKKVQRASIPKSPTAVSGSGFSGN